MSTPALSVVPFPQATNDEAHLARRMAIWGRVPVLSVVEPVRVARLVATQTDVHEATVMSLLTATVIAAIDVAEIGEKLVIVDGHHRATAASRAKATHILAGVRKPVHRVGGAT